MALKFHPDKNHAPGADEAFKVIARAFSTLNDANKRAAYDRYGAQVSETSGGHAAPGHFHFHGHGEMSPEDLFNMFFSTFAQQTTTGAGPQFFFQSFGGGGFPAEDLLFNLPNMRRQHRRRQQAFREEQPATETQEFVRRLFQFLPIILLFFMSLLNSWLFPSNTSSPSEDLTQFQHLVSLTPSASHTFSRVTKLHGMSYYATSAFQQHFSRIQPHTPATSSLARELATYETAIERATVKTLQAACKTEQRDLDRRLSRAKNNPKLQKELRQTPLPSCAKLRTFGYK